MYKIRSIGSLPSFEISTDNFCDNTLDLEEIIYNEIFTDYMWEALEHYLKAHAWESKGFFSESDSYLATKRIADAYFDSHRWKFQIVSEEVDEAGKILRSYSINDLCILKKMVDRFLGDVGSDLYVGKLIEYQLEKFVKKGSWGVGLLLPTGNIIDDLSTIPLPEIRNDSLKWKIDEYDIQPILWFGWVDSSSINRWAITENTSETELAIWSESDFYTIMKSLGDFSDTFIDWYLGERDYYVPDMNEIRENCMIKFDKHTAVKNIIDEVNQMLLQKQKKKSSSECDSYDDDDIEEGFFSIEGFNSSAFTPYEQWWEEIETSVSSRYSNLEEALEVFINAIKNEYFINCECLYHYLTEWGFTDEDKEQMLESNYCSVGLKLYYYSGDEMLELLSHKCRYNTITYSREYNNRVEYGDDDIFIDRIIIYLLKNKILEPTPRENKYWFEVK